MGYNESHFKRDVSNDSSSHQQNRESPNKYTNVITQDQELEEKSKLKPMMRKENVKIQ